jgi:anthranilate synthase component 1
MRTEAGTTPDRDAFEARRRAGAWTPVWTELLADAGTPVGAFPALAGDGPGVVLESVERSERWGRFSFVAGDPAAVLDVDPDGLSVRSATRPDALPDDVAAGPPVDALRRLASTVRADRVEEIPSLAGGLFGYLGYEAAELFDGLPHPSGGERIGPAMSFLLVDRAAVFDHWRQRLVLVAHVPPSGSFADGLEALDELRERLASAPSLPPEPFPSRSGDAAGGFEASVEEHRFREAVGTIREHILAGDIFQAVLSRRLSAPAPAGGLPIYRRLRAVNPSPYMFFLRTPDLELAGSSPEPLVRVERGRVTTRPIAGTRRRGSTPEEDHRLEEELLADPKERAEHAMLVDLARNDVGRVARPGSVEVTELMAVERFSRVMHIVSTVEGDLRDGLTPLDALAAAFPAGTVTGAPKRRAMEIISSLEPTARGPYAGAVGYLSFAGDLDFCITIRTAVVAGGLAHVQAGAGVVADSDPARELRETQEKASALLAALVEPA